MFAIFAGDTIDGLIASLKKVSAQGQGACRWKINKGVIEIGDKYAPDETVYNLAIINEKDVT